MLKYNLRYRIVIALADAAVISLALLFSSYLRINIDLGQPGAVEAFTPPPYLYGVVIVIWWLGFHRGETHKVSQQTTFASIVRSLVSDFMFSALLFLGFIYVVYRDYSRLQAVYFLTSALIGMLALHTVLFVVQHPFARRMNSHRRILIAGINAHAAALGKTVTQHEWYGLHLVGYLDLALENEASVASESIVGGIDDVERLVIEQRVDELILAIAWYNTETSHLIDRIVRTLGGTPVNIRLAPDYSVHAYFRTSVEDFGGMTLIGLREAILNPTQRLIKRSFDLISASLLLVLLSPIMLLTAALIVLDSPGGVFFRQRRIRQYGKSFIMYKFRTMYMGAGLLIEEGKLKKDAADPRVTRIGRWLRRFSLDELPQLINVLRGEMSLIGPRPEIAEIVAEYSWWQRKRLEVPQGMTGWWQTRGRADRPLLAHIDDDLYYIRNYSIWLDFVILLRTLQTVISGRGAY